jgi:DNA mismatch repair protein MutS
MIKAPSPMMRHFLEVKEEHPDTVVLYRCGDFYETFYDDARLVARELDITLTSRDKSSDNPVPMAGVPYHAAENYIRRLREKGYKIAIVEQMEDPKQAKGMVRREVVRIDTPGLTVDTESLQADANNYVVSIFPESDESIGLAVLDLSTGEFRCTQLVSVMDLQLELIKLAPAEVLLPDTSRPQPGKRQFLLPKTQNAMVNYRHEIEYDHGRSVRLLCAQFHTDSLRGFGLDENSPAISAAGSLLSYVQETQKQQANHVTALTPYAVHDYMVIDETTKVNLELERNLLEKRKHGSLLGVLDQCRTAMGSRMLRRWINYPLLKPAAIRERHNLVEEMFLHAPIRETLRDMLSEIGDLGRLASRINMNRCNARDLAGLGSALVGIGEMKAFLTELRQDLFGTYVELIDAMPALADELSRAIADSPPITVREGRMFLRGYNPELDELIELAEHGKDQLLKIEAREREAVGVPSLKIRYNKVFGYYIELSKLNMDKAPARYIRKQTLTNAERYITDELKEFEDKILHAEERRNELEYALFEELRIKVNDATPSLMRTAEMIGEIDALAALADVAAVEDYVRPVITEEPTLDIRDGRHPVVESLQKGEPFIPNDTLLDDQENQLLIVTGPNMAGKSTVMRQVALIVLMAQIGSFVPARSAEIGIVDRIFTRVGAADNLSRGLSTFMVEMTETASILHNATEKSLIILDEIGRGTSTFDGLSIAWAVAEHIHDNIRAKTLFATHYHEMTELGRTKPRVKNMSIAVKEYAEDIIFLRKLVPGATNRSYGIQVGRLAGLPSEVIERAKEVLKNLESGELESNGMPSFARFHSKRMDPNQLSLFGAPALPASSMNDPILVELDRLQPDVLSPLEALNILFEWKKRRRKLTGK